MRGITFRFQIVIASVYTLVLIPLSLHASEEITTENVLPRSLEIAEEVLEAFPHYAPSYFLMGNVYHRFSQFPEAIDMFQKGLAIEPYHADITSLVAFMYSRQSMFEETVEWYERTLELDSEFPRANERLGLALVQLNRMEEARKAFQRAIENNPEDASAHYYLGERYLDEDRLEEAIKEAQITIQLDTRYPEPYYLLSNIYRKQGNAEKAKEMLKKFQQKKDEESELLDQLEEPINDEQTAASTLAQTYVEAGTIFYQQRRDQKAESHFLRALALDSKNELARFHLAHLYQKQGKHDKANMLFGELLAINPDDFRYVLGMGITLAAQKQWLEAERYLKKALQQQSDSIKAKQMLARVYLRTHREPLKALELMKNVIQTEKTALDYNCLSQAYFINGKHKESLDAMREAMRLEPDKPIYRQRYEKILEVLRQNK